jgi:hypothetical protein
MASPPRLDRIIVQVRAAFATARLDPATRRVYPRRTLASIDVGAIVPSTRDLLQVITTRRRNLALLALVGTERADESAARLAELNVSALAFAEPGPAMQLGARSTKTLPSLCLMAVQDRDGCLGARYFGADGVCIDALAPPEEWDRLAKSARTMRMVPLALAMDEAGAEAAVKVGARAVLVRASSADVIVAAARALPRNSIVVAELHGADAAALRGLRGHVDAAVVPPAVHAAADFADFVADVDP